MHTCFMPPAPPAALWPLADQPCQSPPYRYPLPRCSAALPQMTWDHVASALDSRALASRCMPAAASQRGAVGCVGASSATPRSRTQLRTLNRDMLDMDLSSLRAVPWAPRRTVTPPAPPLSGLVHFAHEDADSHRA